MEKLTKEQKVLNIINLCKDMDIDGETTEYILEKIGMTNQMLRQLVMNNPQSDTIDLLNEKCENPALVEKVSYSLFELLCATTNCEAIINMARKITLRVFILK